MISDDNKNPILPQVTTAMLLDGGAAAVVVAATVKYTPHAASILEPKGKFKKPTHPCCACASLPACLHNKRVHYATRSDQPVLYSPWAIIGIILSVHSSISICNCRRQERTGSL